MRKVLIGLVVGAFALAIGGQASATPQFDAVITQVNGMPVAPTASVTVDVSDTVRVTLTLDLQAVDVVGAAAMPMTFDPNHLVLAGPLVAPTFHQPCSFSGIPCNILTGAASNSGSATTDSQAGGLVGSMGAASFAPTGLVAPQSGTLGVVDFHAAGNGGVATVVVPFVQFPGIDGTFQPFGAGPVPFTVGSGATININPIPEPTTALLIGLGLVGIGAAGRRR